MSPDLRERIIEVLQNIRPSACWYCPQPVLEHQQGCKVMACLEALKAEREAYKPACVCGHEANRHDECRSCMDCDCSSYWWQRGYGALPPKQGKRSA